VNTDYRARKVLEPSALPADVRQQAISVRLRVYLGIQDYSWNQGDRVHNGLDEAFEVVVNGVATRYRTDDPRFAAKPGRDGKLRAAWTDFDLPLDSIRQDRLDVIIRKVPKEGKTALDDYVYPGIDNTVTNDHSSVSFDGGETWTSEKLNTIDAQGEYMMRLVVATRPLDGEFVWTPDGMRDPERFAAYAALEGDVLRIEPRPGAWDPARDVVVRVEHDGAPPAVSWRLLDGTEAPVTRSAGPPMTVTLGPCRSDIDALLVEPREGTVVRRLSAAFSLPTTPTEPVVNLRPEIAPPRGRRGNAVPSCRMTEAGATLENAALRATFAFAPRFELTSLYAAEVDRNVLESPDRTHLFRLKVGDRVFGCRDAQVVKVVPLDRGFAAELSLDEVGLTVMLRASVDDDELGLNCTVRNTGAEAARFYLSFPHLAGVQLSDAEADDHYLFPWGGGIIGRTNASLRTAYGENTAWWQMVDLFSPTRGGGLYVRADDPTGLYKVPHLRKGEVVRAEFTVEETGRGFMAPEMQWQGALEPAPGLAVCFDYLRRDRAPGAEFAAPSACIGTHAGDWRAALRRYADWSKRTWPPRPFPSRLSSCWTVFPIGWGQSPLFKDGEYRDDYINDRWDVPELMSWWTWSELGPWNTPLDRIEEELGTTFYERYKAYWVKEPVTGKLMYGLNRGDYDGYMPIWGGLPALREHIQRMKDAGQVPTFYTDPILACATTKLGAEYGPKYGIMNPLWKGGVYDTPKTPEGYVGSYGSYCMCLDTEWYSQWVADAMARVCRETGIDGIRLDEYGHRGYVCHSPHHKHIFAEPGHNAWLQALARNCRQVHAAMDEVRPGLILTTEFPGNDHMAAALDGAIVYDLRRIRDVRPVPLNLFRFFFPECRTMEIDRPHVQQAQSWMLWNATATFGAGPAYPAPVLRVLRENGDAFNGRDIEPLVPTLVERVYANRFDAPDKQVWTVLNACGHTVDTAVLAVPAEVGTHVVDLMTGQEMNADRHGGIALRLRRDECRVLARLPRRIRLTEAGAEIVGDAAGLTLVAVAQDGSPVTDDTDMRAYKLLRDGKLVDIAAAGPRP
jgi:hypothetical protein